MGHDGVVELDEAASVARETSQVAYLDPTDRWSSAQTQHTLEVSAVRERRGPALAPGKDDVRQRVIIEAGVADDLGSLVGCCCITLASGHVDPRKDDRAASAPRDVMVPSVGCLRPRGVCKEALQFEVAHS